MDLKSQDNLLESDLSESENEEDPKQQPSLPPPADPVAVQQPELGPRPLGDVQGQDANGEQVPIARVASEERKKEDQPELGSTREVQDANLKQVPIAEAEGHEESKEDQPELGSTIPAEEAVPEGTKGDAVQQPELGSTMGGGQVQDAHLKQVPIAEAAGDAVAPVLDDSTEKSEKTQPQPQEAEIVTAPETGGGGSEVQNQNQDKSPPETESAQKDAPSCVPGSGSELGDKNVQSSSVLEEPTEQADGAKPIPTRQDPKVMELEAMADKSERVTMLDCLDVAQAKHIGETGDDKEKTQQKRPPKTKNSSGTETETDNFQNIEEALDRSIEEHGGTSMTLKGQTAQPSVVPPKVDLLTPNTKAKAKPRASPASVAKAAAARLSASGSGMGRGHGRRRKKDCDYGGYVMWFCEF